MGTFMFESSCVVFSSKLLPNSTFHFIYKTSPTFFISTQSSSTSTSSTSYTSQTSTSIIDFIYIAYIIYTSVASSTPTSIYITYMIYLYTSFTQQFLHRSWHTGVAQEFLTGVVTQLLYRSQLLGGLLASEVSIVLRDSLQRSRVQTCGEMQICLGDEQPSAEIVRVDARTCGEMRVFHMVCLK